MRTKASRGAILNAIKGELESQGIKSPRDIVSFLDRKVSGQDDAKKAAAMIVWNHIHGLGSRELFIGPSGCGKTHIWRTLQELKSLRRFIMITDSSSITEKGWSGHAKVDSVLSTRFFGHYRGMSEYIPFIEASIVVYDEFDKMVTPKYSSRGSNASFGVQSQMLCLVEGNDICLSEGGSESSESVMINTSGISFVFCGAFADIYKAREPKGQSIGFMKNNVHEEHTEITMDDIIDYGLTPELAGRIGRITELRPLTRSQVRKILSDPETSPVSRYVRTYITPISMTEEYLERVTEDVMDGKLGVRDLSTRVSRDIEDRIFKEETETEYLVLE